MTSDDSAALATKVAELEARVRELEAVQELTLRILSTTKPLDGVLEQFGATETQKRAFYAMLDNVVARARGRDLDRPTFGYFEMQLDEIFPTLRGDRQFTRLLVDTLKVERPAYRELHAYALAHGWPAGA
jgi:hypothetical protein